MWAVYYRGSMGRNPAHPGYSGLLACAPEPRDAVDALQSHRGADNEDYVLFTVDLHYRLFYRG